MDLGLRTDWILTVANGEVSPMENHFVGIKKGKIVEVKKFAASDKKRAKKFIDLKNMVLMPGLVNAHTHLPMTIFRGVEDDLPLQVWLFNRIFPLEAALVNAEMVRAGTELAALECIRFGTTLINDMYFYVEDSAKVWEKAGLRGVFGQAFMDFPIPEDKDFKVSREERFLALQKKFKKSDLIEIGLAPHAPYTCGDAVLKDVARIAKATNSKIQIHLAETAFEVKESKEKFGKSPTARLAELGILTEKTTCAHSIHLDDSDMALLAKHKSSIVYNPDSNAKLASGVCPINGYKKHGVTVALGTDGSASNNDLSMFGAMDIGGKLQKLFSGDSTAVTGADMIKMATWGGAHALGAGDRLGSLEVGKQADMIAVDMSFPHLQPLNGVTSHLAYSANGLEVDTVICNGQVLLRNKKFTKLKPEAVFKKADKYRQKINLELAKIKSKT